MNGFAFVFRQTRAHIIIGPFQKALQISIPFCQMMDEEPFFKCAVLL
jgi:hypothetical protein